MKLFNNLRQKNDTDLLSVSPITQKVLIDNEIRANKIVSIILFAFAGGLLISLYSIASSVRVGQSLIVSFIVVGVALLTAGGGLIGILSKKYHSWMKYLLIFILFFSLYSLSFLLGNVFDLTFVIPLIVSCSYSSKKFSLQIGIFFGLIFLIGDFVSIFTKQYSDLNLLIINEGVNINFSDPYSRYEVPKDYIDAGETFKNFILSYGIYRYSTYVIICFTIYLICSISEKNLISQADAVEKQMRLQEETYLAKDLQANCLPLNFDDIKKKCKQIDIFGLLISSSDIGGDLYNFFLIDDNHLCFMIGDVSARGMEATLFMHTIKESIEEKAKNGLSPKNIFELVNNEVCKDKESGLFVTMWLGILDLSTKVLTYSNAGQNIPLLSLDNKFEYIEKNGSSLFLGGVENASYENKEVKLSKDQKIFLYTDSVVASLNSKKEMFGDKRLISYLNNHSSETVDNIVNGVKSEIENFQNNSNNDDDITMLAIEIKE